MAERPRAWIIAVVIVTGLAVLFAQFGAKMVIAALGGSDDSKDLVKELVGLVKHAEDTSRRLSAIEQKLDTLLNQRFEVAYSSGLRYLMQTLTDPRTREATIARAEGLFVEAAHAGVTGFDRATAERMLLLIRLARGQHALAADSLARLDVLLGDSGQEWVDARKTEDARAERTYVQQTGGFASMRKLVGFRSAAFQQIGDDIRTARDVRGSAIHEMFADCGSVATFFGSPSPTKITLPSAAWDSITVSAGFGEPARAGGVQCVFNAPQRSGTDWVAVARVTVSQERSRPVPVLMGPNILGALGNPHNTLQAQIRTVRPGEYGDFRYDFVNWPGSPLISGVDLEVPGIRFHAPS